MVQSRKENSTKVIPASAVGTDATIRVKFTMRKLILSILLFCISAAVTAQSNNSVKPSDFQAGSKEQGVQLFDVRTSAEFNTGHLPHALQADFTNKDEFYERIKYLNKEQPVYVYCLSGGRSGAAARWMRENGFVKVVELEGGVNAWKQAGLQLEGGQQVAQLSLGDFSSGISEGDVLVDVGAEWCPPCRAMEPVVAAYLKAHKEVKLLKVDGGKDTNVMRTIGATALPTFIYYKDGKELWRRNGVVEL